VIARGFPEFFGTLIVVLKREVGDFLQVLRMQFHIHPTRTTVCLALAACDQRWWKRPGGSIHAEAHNIFKIQRHLTSVRTRRVVWASAMQTWPDAVAAEPIG
jgi:hypothetical protein